MAKKARRKASARAPARRPAPAPARTKRRRPEAGPARQGTAPPAAAPATTPAFAAGEPIVLGRRRQRRLDLRLLHGDVTQVRSRAIVVGVFENVAPTGAARALDLALEGVITEFTHRRMFGGGPGEVFVLPAAQHRIGADLVLLLGLGPHDAFDGEVLRLAATNLVRALLHARVDEFATVMLGAGSGRPLSEVLRSLAEGFRDGLRDAGSTSCLRGIVLCEHDAARYQELRGAILALAASDLFDEIELTLEELPPLPSPPPAPAPTRRAPRPKDPAYLSVRERDGGRRAGRTTFIASLLTAGSRAAVIADEATFPSAKLDALLAKIDAEKIDGRKLPAFGAELGELVLPASVRTVLAAEERRHLVVIQDAAATRIPWELVHVDGWCPALGDGLSRRYAAADLAVAKWLEERRRRAGLDLLLIVNPTGDLDGAAEEGERVEALFASERSVRITKVVEEEATWSRLHAELRSGAYDVVHYAGHAYFDARHRSRSGILCHGERVLSGADLAGIGRLPPLVFFNACEAGRVRGRTRRGSRVPVRERIERTVGLAEAFLRGGVANYVGTYWPVGDEAALSFSKTFYAAVLDGAPLGPALVAGRMQVRAADRNGIDWADYIHYGSADFVLKL